MHIYDFALELSQVRVQQLQGKGRLPGTRSLYRHVSGVSGSDSTGEGLQLLRGSSDSRRQPLLYQATKTRRAEQVEVKLLINFRMTPSCDLRNPVLIYSDL